MTTNPVLSAEQIRRYASPESFARGMSYYQSGAVGDLVLRGDTLQAEVAGSDIYLVQVDLGDGAVLAATCTCPYEWGGWCKHIVATLLAYAQARPGEVAQRLPLAQQLAGLDRDQLAGLLLRLAERDPALADTIDLILATSTYSAGAPAQAAAPAQHVPVDTDAFRRQVRRAFRSASYDDYDAAAGIVGVLEPLREEIRAMIAADNAEDALALLETLTAELSDSWHEYDDSDGELGGFVDSLGPLWAEALLVADLPPDERHAWAERLEIWDAEASNYGVDGLGLAVTAARQGWSDPQLDRAIGGDLAAWERQEEYQGSELVRIRLRVLLNKGLMREALNLAAASGSHREQALILVRLGRIDEALAVARADFSAADEALALAQALQQGGQIRAALAVAEHGLGLAEPRGALSTWLSDLAAGQGQTELALRAGLEAMRSVPGLSLYRRLRELAGAAWPAYQAQIIAALRAAPNSWMGVSGQIDIFLDEGLIDDAIKLVSRPGGASELQRVMDAALTTRAEWVIKTATAQAEAIMNAGKAQHYDTAVEWLRRARDAWRSSGQAAAWDAYMRGVRQQHGRKHKLMGLLDQLARQR